MQNKLLAHVYAFFKKQTVVVQIFSLGKNAIYLGGEEKLIAEFSGIA